MSSRCVLDYDCLRRTTDLDFRESLRRKKAGKKRMHCSADDKRSRNRPSLLTSSDRRVIFYCVEYYTVLYLQDIHAYTFVVLIGTIFIAIQYSTSKIDQRELMWAKSPPSPNSGQCSEL